MSGNRRAAGRHAHVHVDENVGNRIIVIARVVDKIIPSMGSMSIIIVIERICGTMNHGINLDRCWVIGHTSKIKGPSKVFGRAKALQWSSIAAGNDGRRQDQ
jgi:hypothetical protein